jgi:hypothetical protein
MTALGARLGTGELNSTGPNAGGPLHARPHTRYCFHDTL